MLKTLKFKGDEESLWWTSDTHFNHDKPWIVQARGYQNIKEHDEAIINNLYKNINILQFTDDMKKIIYYKVGGTVRDELSGKIPKDLDLVAIGGDFNEMIADIEAKGGKIFLKQELFLTVRCNYPNIGPCDIRLARKDGSYSDGRHPDQTFVAESLYEDSLTRDFTINAMYKDIETDEIIDYHNGRQDLHNKIIRCVGKTADRFTEDGLRVLRAIRFAITKQFGLHPEIHTELVTNGGRYLEKIHSERMREELLKCFKFDTVQTLGYLVKYPSIMHSVLNPHTKIWLKPTTEE